MGGRQWDCWGSGGVDGSDHVERRQTEAARAGASSVGEAFNVFGSISKGGSGCFFALKDGGGTKDDGIVLYHTYRDGSGGMVCR